MEENKNRKNNTSLFKFSIVLSFAVSLFAVFSLAAAGIAMTQGSGVSYALPVPETKTTFTLKMGKVIGAYDTAVASGRQKGMQLETYYYDTVNTDNVVFCVERNKEVDNNKTYKNTDTVRSGKTDIKNDPGLIYLLGIGSNKSSLQAVTQYDDDVDIWTVQSAIWYYLSQKYTDDVYKLHVGTGVNEYLNDKNLIENNGNVYLAIVNPGSSPASVTATEYSGLTGPNGKIMELVNAAKSATSPRVIVTKENDEISKTEDGKFYQSALVTVVGDPSGPLTGYDISLGGIEGAIVVNENGEELATTNVTPGTKFYVRIPAEKVTESVQKVNVGIRGHFNAVSATYYYVDGADDTYQRMASTKPGDVDGGTEVEFVGSPDTGMNTVQTIYFIGLIVLLCGVGIVYANAKPLENKQ